MPNCQPGRVSPGIDRLRLAGGQWRVVCVHANERLLRFPRGLTRIASKTDGFLDRRDGLAGAKHKGADVSIESDLARAAEDVMRAGENLVEVVARAQGTGVDPQGVVLQLIVGHDDPQVGNLRSWAIRALERAHEPSSA
jgi:hypothetical protein